ncbi:MAG: YlxR family protein [Lachnospiraceae bacterium]|nr:YlxR family protein [Lachnospiraceae bacterium]
MPERSCAACGRKGEKGEFVRALRLPDGTFTVDATGKMSGRGAYLCRNAECIRIARKKNSLARSFRQAVPEEIYGALEACIGE